MSHWAGLPMFSFYHLMLPERKTSELLPQKANHVKVTIQVVLGKYHHLLYAFATF